MGMGMGIQGKYQDRVQFVYGFFCYFSLGERPILLAQKYWHPWHLTLKVRERG